MNDSDYPVPIQIDPTSSAGQLFAMLRYLIVAGGGYATGTGAVSDETLQVLLALVTVVLPTLYGMYKTWTNERTKRHLATGEAVGIIRSSGKLGG